MFLRGTEVTSDVRFALNEVAMNTVKNDFMPITESGSYPIPGHNLVQYYPGIIKWIDNGEFNFNIEEELTVEQFSKISGVEFDLIAKCVYNTRDNFPIRYNKDGNPSGNTKECIDGIDDEIKVVGYVPIENMKDKWKLTKTEWVYVIAWNGYILKIGMTSAGMSQRFSSYECGYKSTMRKGSPATTNFVINEANYLALSKGYDVEVYAHKLQPASASVSIGNNNIEVRAEIAPEVETHLTELYAKVHGKNAPLCGQKKVKVKKVIN